MDLVRGECLKLPHLKIFFFFSRSEADLKSNSTPISFILFPLAPDDALYKNTKLHKKIAKLAYKTILAT